MKRYKHMIELTAEELSAREELNAQWDEFTAAVRAGDLILTITRIDTVPQVTPGVAI